MDSNTVFISLIYYVGIASCAAQGAEKRKHENNIPIFHYVVNAFGGGFIRDFIFLRMYPWLFTTSALPDLMLVILVGFLYTYFFFIHKANKRLYDVTIQVVSITDAIGLGSFICIGMDKAFIYSDNAFIITICGYITAIGGGILASGKPLITVFKNQKSVRYHFVTLLGCINYYIYRHSFFLVCFVAIVLFLTNINYKNLNHFYPCNLITLCPDVFFLYPAIYDKNNNIQRQKTFKTKRKLNPYPVRPKIYLMQHRIRQC